MLNIWKFGRGIWNKHETTIKKKTNLHVVWKQNALWNLVIKSLAITFQTFAIFLRSLFLLCLFVCCLLFFKTLEALIRANSSAIFVFSIFTVCFSSEYMFIHKPTFTALRVVFLSLKIIPVYKVIRIQIPLQNQQWILQWQRLQDPGSHQQFP